MTDFVEYKRPFIVLLVFSLLILIFVNYGADMFKYENFVDPPYSCSTSATDRTVCIKEGGYWAQDGNLPTGCSANCNCCIPNASFPTSMKYPAPNCPATSATYTITDANSMFSSSMLPTSSPTRGADGVITAAAIQLYIEDLVKTNRLLAAPAVSGDSQAIYAYLQADETAINALQIEYCYYSARYTYAITQIIQYAGEAPAASPGSASASAAPVANPGADWLAVARTLNTRLIDLITIMKYLTTQRLAYGADPSTTQLNADLAVRIKSLSDQSNDLVGPNANTTLYKKMVEYTNQKGKSNGNLVLLYTFMNIIALGMLFYVYSAT